MAQRGRKPYLSAEREALLARCVADGWPKRQITETHGFNFYTIKRLHPEYRGMSDAQECGKLSAAVQKTNGVLEKTYGKKRYG